MRFLIVVFLLHVFGMSLSAQHLPITFDTAGRITSLSGSQAHQLGLLLDRKDVTQVNLVQSSFDDIVLELHSTLQQSKTIERVQLSRKDLLALKAQLTFVEDDAQTEVQV